MAAERRRHGLPVSKTSQTLKASTPEHLSERLRAEDPGFQQSVKKCLHLAEKNRLVSYNDLPVPWRINPYIRTGYRFTTSFLDTLQSLWRISNETANIWTHLIPIFLILWYSVYVTPPFEKFRGTGVNGDLDAQIALGYYVAVACSLLCSVIWHTFKCNSRVRLISSLVSLDVMSISLILTAFNILTINVAFYTSPVVRKGYTISSLVWCIGGLILPWTNVFRPIELASLRLPLPTWWPFPRVVNRVIFFVGLAIQGTFMPVAHCWIISGHKYTFEVYKHILPVATPMFLGSIAYCTKFPEKVWPGKFDYIGCSHNVWHIGSALAAWNGCQILLPLFEVAWNQATLVGNREKW